MSSHPVHLAGSVALTRARTALAALVLTVGASAALSTATARAATTPAAGTSVYQETFENSSTPPTILDPATGAGYTGAAAADSATYSGSGAFVQGTYCDGWITDLNLIGSPPTTTDNCFQQNTAAWPTATALADILGQVQGESGTQAAANNALTDLTADNSGPGVVFQTSTVIPAVGGHFYQVRADYAAHDYTNNSALGAGCDSGSGTNYDPTFSLSLVSASNTSTSVASGIDPCTMAGTKAYTIASGGTTYTAAAGEYDAPAVQWPAGSGSTMSLKQTDATNVGSGNDSATDDLRVVDVSPTLSEAFSSDQAYAGQPSTLTFTITNTSELGAKNGWTLSQALPAGVTIASTPDATTTCAAGSIAATQGGSSIAVTGGDIASGVSSCTVSVNVVPASAGTYTASPSSATTTGLLTPAGTGTATLSAADPSNGLTITQSASPSPYQAGAPLTYTVTVANAGPQSAQGVVVSDALPSALQAAGFTWTCTASTGSACTASGNGGVSDTANVAVAGTVTYTITGTVPASTTGPLLNSVTVTPSAGTTDPACSPSCTESSTTSQAATAPAGSAGTASLSPDAIKSGLVVSPTGQLTIALLCSTSGSCTSDGVLSFTTGSGSKARMSVIATFTATQIAAGQSATVPLTLSAATLRRLQALGINPLEATLTVTSHLADGLTSVSTQRITLRVPLACLRATGSVSSKGLGRFRLGTTTSRTRQIGKFRTVHHAYDSFCVRGGSVRVNYLTLKTLHKLHVAHAARLKSRVVVALTSNHHYAVHGVRARMTVKAAKRRLRLGHGTRIGQNTWYIATSHRVAYVFRIRRGKVRQIGVVNRALTRTPALRHYLLRHI